MIQPTAGLATDEFGLGLFVGFLVVLSLTFLVIKLGDVLYHKGIAKPFYVLDRRFHHKDVLLAMIPASYLAIATLVYFHYMRVLWSSFWPSVAFTVFLMGLCLTFDMAWDFALSKRRTSSLFHHEWVYLLLPAYIFTHLVAIA